MKIIKIDIKEIAASSSEQFFDPIPVYIGPKKLYFSLTHKDLACAYMSVMEDRRLCVDIDDYVFTHLNNLVHDTGERSRPFKRNEDVVKQFPTAAQEAARNTIYKYMIIFLYNIAINQPRTRSLSESGLVQFPKI